MHRALEIQDILLDIFCHFSPQTLLTTYDPDHIKATSNLAALARTCRTFKEPALDVLWKALSDSSPLARCLPDASQKSASGNMVYSFSRPLTQIEWGTLRSYTSRIQFIDYFEIGLDWESVVAFVKPSTTEPLFPNLRSLGCLYATRTMPWLDLPLPSLLDLHVVFEDQDSFDSFPSFSPGIETLAILVDTLVSVYTNTRMKPNYICRWQNLQIVNCPRIILDTDDLVHLSHLPALAELECAASTALPAPNSPLVFFKLRILKLRSESLNPISRLFSQMRLPVLSMFFVAIINPPSSVDLTSTLADVPTSCTDHTIEVLRLSQLSYDSYSESRSKSPLLGFKDLRPCMALKNLRRMEINVECNVDMTDGHLLTLTSAWPNLEHFLINEEWGWNTVSGITPDGLVQLLLNCRSLSRIAVQLDTRVYARVPPSRVPQDLGWRLSNVPAIDVVDSSIEVESTLAVAAFLCNIATCAGKHFSFKYWGGTPMEKLSKRDEYMELWDFVFHQIDDVLEQDFE